MASVRDGGQSLVLSQWLIPFSLHSFVEVPTQTGASLKATLSLGPPRRETALENPRVFRRTREEKGPSWHSLQAEVTATEYLESSACFLTLAPTRRVTRLLGARQTS